MESNQHVYDCRYSGEIEQACSRGENVSIELLTEMHAITRFLHETGFVIKTVRNGSKLIVEVEPLVAVEEYEWNCVKDSGVTLLASDDGRNSIIPPIPMWILL